MPDTEKPQRTFWTTGRVQVQDLRNGDVALHNGAWLYVYNVHADDSSLKAEYGENFAQAQQEAAEMNEVCRLVEFGDDRNADIDDFPRVFRRFTQYDLVEIQVPIPSESA